MHPKLQRMAVWLPLFCTVHSISLAAINIIGYDPLVNDRFANDASFIASGFDLSGVAIADDGRWVTMLSDNVFVTADHFYSSNGTSVTFYGSNDPLGSSFTTSIESSVQLGTTDIRLGVLSDALPTGYSSYDIFNYPIPPNTNAIAVGMFGRSPSDYPTSLDMSIGQNVMNGFLSDFTADGNTGDAGYTTFDMTGGLAYEAQLTPGDSGAPVVAVSGGELTIVGVNWYIATDTSNNEVSGFSYLPNYIAEIDSFIAANALTPVPEPAAAALVLGMLACLAAVRRR